MRVNDVRNQLDSNELVFAIQKTINAMTERLKVALPRGWRLIVKVACENGKEAPPPMSLCTWTYRRMREVAPGQQPRFRRWKSARDG